jgi:hypothetical protein
MVVDNARTMSVVVVVVSLFLVLPTIDEKSIEGNAHRS